MIYIVRLLKYLKLVEPNLNLPNLLKRIGMSNSQIIKVMNEYNKGEEKQYE